uniref:Uncharacterized protein n=1 Tax=Arundo donax TaxID=35708 RepID=A0A0A9AR21_ARUDO
MEVANESIRGCDHENLSYFLEKLGIEGDMSFIFPRIMSFVSFVQYRVESFLVASWFSTVAFTYVRNL